MTMTPFKSNRGGGLFPNEGAAADEPEEAATNGVCLFGAGADDDGVEDMDTMMSPPRVANKTSNLPTADLFGNKETTADDNGSRGGRRRRMRIKLSGSLDGSFLSDVSVDDGSSILRNMDMNSSSPSSTTSRRKRPSDQHPAGREEYMEESEDDDMFVSPRASPTFRTMDGRTVTSKNPFSPYTPTQDSDCMSTDLQTAPTFPFYGGSSRASFDSTETHRSASSEASSITGPVVRPKLNLTRRTSTSVYAPQQQQLSRAGYPDQHGRYSFTGSPIEEVDFMEQDNSNNMGGSKIRRLTLDDTASSTTAHSLFVDTEPNDVVNTTIDDGISPADVMNFPTPPSAPKKAARPPTRYTPLKKAAPPQTPMPARRNVARRPLHGINDDDNEAMDTTGSSSQPKSRFHQDFDIIGELGMGSFGTVYKCLSRLDGCMYAVKAAKRQAKGIADRDRMLKEVYALAALSDQADTAAFHCVRYHQAWMEENRLYIQTELCTSTLQAEMNRGPLTEQRKWKLLREMLLALEFIHRNGMVHLDLKPENIFVKNDQFKLGDFGLVSKTTSSNDVEEGDSRYMSKELLSGDHDDLTKSDIFSLGATMYEICLGRPLPSDGQEWQDIRAGSLQPLHGTPYDMELIIKKMMHPDPSMRPTASQLLKQKQLLSEEQKQLMAEKSKVLEANLALALQTQKMKKLTPPRPGGLTRANTWNGGSFHL